MAPPYSIPKPLSFGIYIIPMLPPPVGFSVLHGSAFPVIRSLLKLNADPTALVLTSINALFPFTFIDLKKSSFAGLTNGMPIGTVYG